MFREGGGNNVTILKMDMLSNVNVSRKPTIRPGLHGLMCIEPDL